MQTPQLPNFDLMTWLCRCCKQKRHEKYLKFITHDISHLFKAEVGTVFINVKYCVDMEPCKLKAENREWVYVEYLNAISYKLLSEKVDDGDENKV